MIFLDCAKLKFDDADKKSSKQDNAAIFALYAYVNYLDAQHKTTAFNLSISDINFHSKEMLCNYTIEIFNIQIKNKYLIKYFPLLRFSR